IGDQSPLRDCSSRCARSCTPLACHLFRGRRSGGVRLSERSLSLLVLGCGKTGSIVAEVARERGHRVQNIDVDVNEKAAWLTSGHMQDFDVVIDFTAPDAVLGNIGACLRAKKAMVVGTTGW